MPIPDFKTEAKLLIDDCDLHKQTCELILVNNNALCDCRSDVLYALTSALQQAWEDGVRSKGFSLFSVDFDKNGEMDFGVRGDMSELTYEQMRRFREMVVVGIGVAEQRWHEAQMAKHPAASASLLPNPTVTPTKAE